MVRRSVISSISTGTIDEVKGGNWSVGGKIVTASDARRLQQTKAKAA